MPITKASGNSVTAAAKGDLVVGSATNDSAILSTGTTGQVLTVDSTTATGLKWATPSAGANWSLVNAGGTALTGASTITVSGISNADKIMVLLTGADAGTFATISIRLNTDTGSNYYSYGNYESWPSTYAAGNYGATMGASSNVPLFVLSSNASSTGGGYLLISGSNSSGVKIYNGSGGAYASGGDSQANYNLGGYYNSSSTISSVSVVSSSGNFTAGTIFVYTSA